MFQALPFLLLWLSGLALWCAPASSAPRSSARASHWLRSALRPWCLIWLLAWASAGAIGLLDARGAAVVLACIACAAWWHSAPRALRSPRTRRVAMLAVGAFALSLALHAWPGIGNPLVLDAVSWRPGDPAFSLRASFDKACAGLLLLATVVPRAKAANAASRWVNPVAWAATLTTAATLGLAWALGLTEPAPSWPQVPGRPEALALFLLLNLFVTCVAEEAFFRGWLQSALAERLGAGATPGRFVTTAVAIGLPALLFGLAHLGGGPLMAALATLVGAGSGWAFARTGRIEAAVIVHFAVNATHLLAFTYPARMA